jgi:integrase
MARPPLVLGTWGNISTTGSAGNWSASARFRDFDGVTRQVRRAGTSRQKAKDALVEHLRDRVRLHGADLNAEARVSILADRWYDTLLGKRATGTLDVYRRTIKNHVRPALGELRIREVTVPVVDRHLVAVEENVGKATAALCRVVLMGMFSLAVRHGAAAMNPVRETENVTPEPGEIHTISRDEVILLRSQLQDWDAAKDRGGRQRLTDLADVFDMLIATGIRTGEALAVRWEDVDLRSEVKTVTITGTAVHVRGEGLQRQPKPKTAAGFRTLSLPAFAVRMLVRRGAGATTEWVFPSSVGTLRSPNNMRTQWRTFREAFDYPDWLVPYTCRKTVATMIRDGQDLDAAAQQLGHVDTRWTRDHYTGHIHHGPDVRDILDQFGTD